MTNYKILEYESYPSDTEIDAYYNSKSADGVGELHCVSYKKKFPSQRQLEERAKQKLEQAVNVYLVDGWKLQGSMNVLNKGRSYYPTFKMSSSDWQEEFIERISYSQAIYKE